MPLVLITRPEAQATQSAETFRAAGWQVMLAPVMRLCPSLPATHPHWKQAASSDALIFTSQMALTLYPFPAEAYQGKVYVTGEVLKTKAEAQGFRDVFAAHGDATSLFLLLQHNESSQSRLCYPHGRVISKPLVKWLRDAGFTSIHTFEAYHSVKVEAFADEVRQALEKGDVDAITCYSVQTAEHFIYLCKAAALWEKLSQKVIALCLSEAIADVLRNAGWLYCQIPSLSGNEKELCCDATKWIDANHSAD